MTDTDAARAWLEWLYGDRPDGLLWIGGHGDGFRGRTFTNIEAAVDYAAELDSSSRHAAGGVYHRLTTMRHVEKGRGSVGDSAYLPAFAMDLDLRGPGHKALNYPETETELVTLLRKAGLPEPSAWVHSGGGRYPFWKLEQPLDLTLPGELERAATVSQDLHRLVIEWAGDNGWKVDNTSDLARVYRLPGTMNRKGPEPIMCTIASPHAGDNYGLTEIAGSVSLAARPAPIDPGPPQKDAAPEALSRGLEPQSQLFADAVLTDGPRLFTVSEAMAFVQPFLEALRSARDGEINVRLNDAAKAISHFGEEFWSSEAADTQLYGALEATDYDGRTWKAADTIDSARRSARDDWKAELRLEPTAALEAATGAVEVDAVEALLAELLTPEQIKERPGKKYLIKGILNYDSESWIIGAPGCRKSFVMLDMAAHIAGGRDWQGLRTRQGPVVIIAAEGAGGIGARVKAWEVEHGPMSADIHILPRPVQVTDVNAWAVLVKACERIRPAMVVIDTQARVTAGLNENDSKDMSIFLVAVTAIRRATAACVVAIHHTGRAGADARGHSSMDGAQDTELKVVVGKEPLTGELRIEKQKDLAEAEPVKLRFRVHTIGQDEDGDPITSLALAAASQWEDAANEPQVEEWEAGHAAVIVQLFKVLRDQGGTAGLTKAEAHRSVVELHYGGESKRLAKTTWYTGWDRALAKVSASGDPVMVRTGGARFTVDPAALSLLEPEKFSPRK